MKKTFLLLLSIVALSISTAFAQHFVGFSQDMTSESYVDLDSVNVTRYAPPYYIIDVTYAHKLLDRQETYIIKERFLYDYDNQEVKISHVAQNHMDKYGRWSGWKDYMPQEPHIVKPNSLAYILSNVAFYKAYHMAFNKEFQEQSGSKLGAYK